MSFLEPKGLELNQRHINTSNSGIFYANNYVVYRHIVALLDIAFKKDTFFKDLLYLDGLRDSVGTVIVTNAKRQLVLIPKSNISGMRSNPSCLLEILENVRIPDVGKIHNLLTCKSYIPTRLEIFTLLQVSCKKTTTYVQVDSKDLQQTPNHPYRKHMLIVRLLKTKYRTFMVSEIEMSPSVGLLESKNASHLALIYFNFVNVRVLLSLHYTWHNDPNRMIELFSILDLPILNQKI
ncbi:uncharacterized protein EV154DRAFT_482298 [Mucor mucedo]|uniref:uncharacterized protein n=1 Tax=Mucor mucedo TaxID=29922 RepID=UPI00221E7C0F|nr:uncharacterized protein EV154DRAFT_482298 [Mucor mucedo]KAI7890311.1 hypothetical protein EV154DRAFT_482298 [Mucor mucedo]